MSSPRGEFSGSVGSTNDTQPLTGQPIDGQSIEHSTSPSNATDAQSKPSRKAMRRRSELWEHFVQTRDVKGRIISAKCNYCNNVFAGGSSKTSSLRSHICSCIKNPLNVQAHEKFLSLQPTVKEGKPVGGSLTAWKYDYDEIREAISYMIIVDELPFKFVEGKGLKRLLNATCPGFNIPSRWSVSRDCYGLYVSERTKLKSFLEKNCQRVSLTTDTWTSLQGIDYMCITAHFIDNQWNLHKKVLNFVPISSHKGDYIGKTLETCVLDWGLKNVFTITIDNADSNDTAIAFLKKRMKNWGGSVASCKYLHMRCIAHIINLVVFEGLKDVNLSVKRVRDAVRYIKSSPVRIRKFKECVELEGIEIKRSLCLDEATRWDSTYLMLSTAEQFEKAFYRYETEDASFGSDLGGDGSPTSYDWSCVRKISDLLKHFYVMILRISGSSYVTSNTFYDEITYLYYILNEWTKSDDLMVKSLGDSMKTKFDKYWGDPERMNKIIFWANIFDPHDKFEFMKYSLHEMFGAEKADKMLENLKNEFVELFNEYKRKYQPEIDAIANNGKLSNSSSEGRVTDSDLVSSRPGSLVKARYKRQKMESEGNLTKKSELEVYLNEDVLEDTENFDVLKWWKLNSQRFPVLSRMARDMLCVPISTMASDSTFSTGGRVLDSFRSSLTPKIVEALICAQDWLRDEAIPICVEEHLEEIEDLEEDLLAMEIGTSLSKHPQLNCK